jgi:hypothetical protein
VSLLPHYLQRAMYSPKRGEMTGEEIHLTDAPKLAPGTAMPGQTGTPEDGPG